MTPSSKRVPPRAATSRRDRALHAGVVVTIFLWLVGGAQPLTAGINLWTAHGVPSGWVSEIAVDPLQPNTLYAVMGAGLFRSTDNGGTWSAFASDLGVLQVTALAIDPKAPKTIYLAGCIRGTNGCQPGGIFRSIDSGGHWRQLEAGPKGMYTLAIDPVAPSTLYAGTGVGVFKSTDSGDTWNAVNSGLPELSGSYIQQIAVDPVNSATLYALAYGIGLFKSQDGGDTWGAIRTGVDSIVGVLTIDPVAPSTLYAGSYGYGLFKSTDAGSTWSKTGLPVEATFGYVNALAVDPINSATLYAGTRVGVFKSTDAGETWSAANTGLPPDYLKDYRPGVMVLAVNPTAPATLYAFVGANFGVTGGVFKSTDAGGTWKALDAGPTFVSALTIDPVRPSTLYATTSFSGVFKSTDGASTWSAANTGLRASFVTAIAVDPKTPMTLYAGGYSCASNGCSDLFKSTDGGDTWNALETGSTSVFALAIDPTMPATIYAGTAEGVIKSADSGGTWGPLVAIDAVGALGIDPSAPETLYALSGSLVDYSPVPSTDFVKKSTDGGGTWNTVYGDAYESIWALAIDPRTTVTLYVGTYSLGLIKSTDGGGNWSAANTGLTDTWVRALAIDPATPTTLYVGTSGGVFKSIEGGGTWSAFNPGLSAGVRTLAIDPKTPTRLYAGTDNGVFAIDQVSARVGDCDGTGRVTVDELITLVNVALGNAQPAACPNGVPGGAEVDVALIIQAVNNTLSGCGGNAPRS